jgi:hypothetical protein
MPPGGHRSVGLQRNWPLIQVPRGRSRRARTAARPMASSSPSRPAAASGPVPASASVMDDRHVVDRRHGGGGLPQARRPRAWRQPVAHADPPAPLLVADVGSPRVLLAAGGGVARSRGQLAEIGAQLVEAYAGT